MERVFVYGTLLEGFANHAFFLSGKIASVSEGSIRGVLYHLPEGYPGLLEGEGTVKGQVVELLSNETIKDLDMLEGYHGEGKQNLYTRVQTVALLDDATEVPCWVYVYQKTAHAQMDGELVADGDWRRFNAEKVLKIYCYDAQVGGADKIQKR